MKSIPTRLCIYPKDVQRITGKSERYSRMLLQKIKASLGKERNQFITIKEFSNFTGVEEKSVIDYIL